MVQGASGRRSVLPRERSGAQVPWQMSCSDPVIEGGG